MAALAHAGHRKHFRRRVDSCDPVAPTCQFHGKRSGSAAEIDN